MVLGVPVAERADGSAARRVLCVWASKSRLGGPQVVEFFVSRPYLARPSNSVAGAYPVGCGPTRSSRFSGRLSSCTPLGRGARSGYWVSFRPHTGAKNTQSFSAVTGRTGAMSAGQSSAREATRAPARRPVDWMGHPACERVSASSPAGRRSGAAGAHPRVLGVPIGFCRAPTRAGAPFRPATLSSGVMFETLGSIPASPLTTPIRQVW